MKKLLLGLVSVFFVGSVNAQLAFDKQVVNGPKPNVKSSLAANLFGSKADDNNRQAKNNLQFKASKAHLWANANTLTKQSMNTLPVRANSLVKAQSTRAGENNYTWWGYANSGSDLGALGFDGLATNFGVDALNGQTEYNVAYLVPETYAKAKIDSVQLLVVDAQYKDLTIWIDNVKIAEDEQGQYVDIPATAADADYSYTVPASEIPTPETGYVGPVRVKLPKSFAIGSTGCLVGYSFTGAAGESPIVGVYNTSTVSDGAFLFQVELEGVRDFVDLSPSNSANMSLATLVGLDLSDCEANNAQVAGSPERTALVGAEASYNFYIQNNSAKPITSISYVLTVDNNEGQERTQTLTTPIEAGSYTSIPYVGKFDEPGLHDINLTVTKVNGNDNVADNIDASNTAILLEKGADRVNVVEELTSTGLGSCPRGIVALEHLNKDLGDKVITIAGHFNYDSSSLDPMNIYNSSTDIADYGNVLTGVSQMLGGPILPGALFNRVALADPYVGATNALNDNGTYNYGATRLVQIVDSIYPSEADFKMDASWVDDTKEAVNVDVTANFHYDRFGEFPYGIGFIFVENGLTGTAGTWRQQNGYNDMNPDEDAHYFNNPDMAYWFNASTKVRTSYNNVAVDFIEPVGRIQIAESDNADVVADKDYNFKNVLGLSSNLIQDKDQLSLVAILVNLKSYAIVNAARVYLGDKAAGIEDVNSAANNTVVSRYNLNGMNLSAPQKGINLVKTADGNVVKVAVK